MPAPQRFQLEWSREFVRSSHGGTTESARGGGIWSYLGWMRRTFYPLLVAGAVMAFLSACESSDTSPQDLFLAEVLTCPAIERLPQNRTPTCEVPSAGLLFLGVEACNWLQDQPMARDAPESRPYWKDPYDLFNVASRFARQARTTAAVPLQDAEQSLVASQAWRSLCLELDTRYNYHVYEYSD